MINFYKDNNVPKIQFADGQTVSFLGRVTIAADNSTGQLIIAEDGHDKFWISTSQTLQVNGANITGTNQQKADLIAPLFVLSPGSNIPANLDGIADTATRLAVSPTEKTNWNAKQPAGSYALNLIPTSIKTTAYTAAAGELVKVDATAANVPITLPTAPADKTRIAVKMIAVSGSNVATIATGGTDVFNKSGGSTSATLTLLNQAVTIQYESATGIWSVISSDMPLSQLDGRFAGINGATVYNSGKNIPVGPGATNKGIFVGCFHRGKSARTQTDQSNYEKLWLSASSDGIKFRHFMDGWKPSVGSVRDPVLFFYKGNKYVIYTSGSFGASTSVGLARFDSGLANNPTELSSVSFAPIANSGSSKVWAPYPFIDSDGTLYIFSAASSNGSLFSVAETHTTDMVTWSTPSLISISGQTSDANGIIDPAICKVGSTYHLLFKVGFSQTTYIEHATSSNVTGPFVTQNTGDWAGLGNAIEAPSIVDLDGGRYRIYVDSFSTATTYYTETTDWVTFTAKKKASFRLAEPRHISVSRFSDLATAQDIVSGFAAVKGSLSEYDADQGQPGVVFPSNIVGVSWSSNTPASGAARIIRGRVTRKMLVKGIAFAIRTTGTTPNASDTCEVAIYDGKTASVSGTPGTRITTSGAVAGMTTATNVKSVLFPSPVWIEPGEYYLGLGWGTFAGGAPGIESGSYGSTALASWFGGSLSFSADCAFSATGLPSSVDIPNTQSASNLFWPLMLLEN